MPFDQTAVERDEDYHGTGDDTDDESSIQQLPLPDSIDDSLNIDGMLVINGRHATDKVQKLEIELQQARLEVKRLKDEKSFQLDSIRNGAFPTDEDFERITDKSYDQLSFIELFWKTVYDSVFVQKQELLMIQQKGKEECARETLKLSDQQLADSQSRVTELKNSLAELNEKCGRYDIAKCDRDAMEEKLIRVNKSYEQLEDKCAKMQQEIVDSQSTTRSEKNEDECRKKEIALREAVSKCDDISKYTSKRQDSEMEKRMMEELKRNREETRRELENTCRNITIGYERENKLLLQSKADALLQLDAARKEVDRLRSVLDSWSSDQEAMLKPLEASLYQSRNDLHEKTVENTKLHLIYEENESQLKASRVEVQMLEEQVNVLRREFDNLEKETLFERKRLTEEIQRRDEQIEIYFDIRCTDTGVNKKEVTKEAPSPVTHDSIRCLLDHALVLGKKCKQLQARIAELEEAQSRAKHRMDQKINIDELKENEYQVTIRSLEEQNSILQRHNKDFRTELDRVGNYNNYSPKCLTSQPLKQNPTTNKTIHHVYIMPSTGTRSSTLSSSQHDMQRCISGISSSHELDIVGDDERSIHLDYRGPGSFVIGNRKK